MQVLLSREFKARWLEVAAGESIKERGLWWQIRGESGLAAV